MGSVKISDALGSGLVKLYWHAQYTSRTENYYSKNALAEGKFYGKLAEQWGMLRAVTKEEFDLLADGRHPVTGEQLVQWVERVKALDGEEMQHRSAYDVCIAPHKSISAAALVGGDERLIALHLRSCYRVMEALEEYTQARTSWGGPQTENLIAALFTHTSARPVGGVPDPHLHTHFVVFNMTDSSGKIRALQPISWYRMQRFLDAVYQAEMAVGLQRLGYLLDRNTAGKYAAIEGYSKEYLLEISKRTTEIENKKKELGLSGARADKVIAHQYREAKVDWPEEQMREYHRELSRQFKIDPDAIPNAAKARPAKEILPEGEQEALTFAKHSLSERTAAFERYELYEQALRYGLGSLRLRDVHKAFQTSADFLEIDHWRTGSPGKRYTTPEMLRLEREVIQTVAAGRNTMQAFAPEITRDNFRETTKDRGLTNAQKWLAFNVLTCKDRILGIQGGAGVGKTRALEPIREMLEEHGYQVYGTAPTSGAASELNDAGLTNSQTIQRFLATAQEPATGPRVIFLDESSLADIEQVHRLFHEKLQPQDRVILAGDIHQHQSVGAGRIFEELQMAGMTTYGLHKIMRQQDPDLLAAVKEFSVGRSDRALAIFEEHGWIHEREGKLPRLRDLAEDFAASPGNTLAIDPRNDSVIEINNAVRERIRRDGHVEDHGHVAIILHNRQELTAEQKKYAWSYREGDVLRFPKSNRKSNVKAGSYAKVESIDRDHNTLTLRDGERTFPTKPIAGVGVFTEEKRELAVGDRIQFTQPWRAQRIDNRDFGDITYIDDAGNMRVRLYKKSNRTVSFNLSEMRHLDYGYAVTSYAVQGSWKENVLIHVAAADTRNLRLIDQAFGYVGTSRARESCRIYCDDKEALGHALAQLHLKPKAHSPEQIREYRHEQRQQLERTA